ncbi:MAG: DUF3576 domain-containing protein [Rhodospirillales bacterium]|nr:DUF3576 domain-containing protein [Rhodospirillales bacterium]
MHSQGTVARRALAGGGRLLAALLFTSLLLAGCGNVKTENEYPDPDPKGGKPSPYGKADSIFGEGGLSFGTGTRRREDEEGGGGIGVNSFLWRASLDTVAFMPVASADPFGGVIITDWYAMPEAPGERFKINVYILGRSLRADGVKVAIFRQVQGPAGEWQDTSVPVQTASSIEDSILTRARQLRFDTMQQ